MIPTTGHAAGLTEVTRPPAQEPAGGSGGELRRLFPDPPAAPPPTWRRRMLTAAAAVPTVVAGAAVLLLRVPGVPSWDTIYAEDYNQFLLIALQHPWDLLVQYNGYEQLLPRAVA